MSSNHTLPEDVRTEAVEALAVTVCQMGGHLPNRDRSLPGSCAFHKGHARGYIDAIAPLLIEWARKDALLSAADELRLDRREGSTFTKVLPLATAERASKHAEDWLRERARFTPETTGGTTNG